MAHLPLLCFINIDLTQLFENSGNLREAPSPEQARMVVLVDNLVLPSHLRRDIDSVTAYPQHRIDIRLERISDHKHLLRRDTHAGAKLRIHLRRLLVDHIHELEKMPQSWDLTSDIGNILP